MKKQAYLVLSILFLFTVITSCTGVKTVAKGLENESFIEFIGVSSHYTGGVDVFIDDDISFKAEVNKGYSKRPKGNVYAISSGKHTISVSYQNKLIYKKEIFVGAQETKQIQLP